jgi:hypothetical protein
VRMEFSAPDAPSLQPLDRDSAEPAGPAHRALPGTVELTLAPRALVRAVLPRVLSTLAGRAHFSTDRISDVQLVADVLAANAGDSISGSHVHVGIEIAPRNLELRIGPLRTGRGKILAAAADGVPPVIERLTDEKRVARSDCAETLELRLVDQR